MRQAIIVKATRDRNGNRWLVARCAAGMRRVPWEGNYSHESNHEAAALALALKLGWMQPIKPLWTLNEFLAKYVGGTFVSGNVECYAFVEKADPVYKQFSASESDDDADDPLSGECPACGADALQLIGTLGERHHFKCRACGIYANRSA